MLKRFSLITLAAATLYGCGDNEYEAPNVPGDSVFTCGQLNKSDALNDHGYTRKIMDSATNTLDKAYLEDTAVQRFFQGNVMKDVDYNNMYKLAMLEACSGDSDKGVNEAATEALNTTFDKIMHDPRFSLCKGYTDGNFTTEQMFEGIGVPANLDVAGDLVAKMITITLNDARFGPEYIETKTLEKCEAKPDMRVYKALYAVGTEAISGADTSQ